MARIKSAPEKWYPLAESVSRIIVYKSSDQYLVNYILKSLEENGCVGAIITK